MLVAGTVALLARSHLTAGEFRGRDAWGSRGYIDYGEVWVTLEQEGAAV